MVKLKTGFQFAIGSLSLFRMKHNRGRFRCPLAFLASNS